MHILLASSCLGNFPRILCLESSINRLKLVLFWLIGVKLAHRIILKLFITNLLGLIISTPLIYFIFRHLI